MHDKQRFQLIDGTFSPSKAGQVLHSLVQSKIDYHSLQKLSDLERFGKDRSQSELRLEQLLKLRTDLKNLLDSAHETHQTLEIHCWIEITQDLPAPTPAAHLT